MGRTTLQHEFAISDIAGVELRRDYRFGVLDFFLMYLLSCTFGWIGFGLTTALCHESVALGIFLGLVVGIAGQIPFFMVKKHFVTKALSSIVGIGALVPLLSMVFVKEEVFLTILMIIILVLMAIIFIISMCLICFIPNLCIDIKTNGGTPSVQIRRDKKKGFLGIFPPVEEYSGYKEVLPWKDTELAIRELGAIISDIQKLGDFGIEKWKK